MRVVTFLILIVAASRASAAGCQPELPPDAKTACEESAVADSELNATYQRILKAYDERIKQEPKFAEAKTALINAQRQWIKFRKADCDAVYEYNAAGTIRIPAAFYCDASHSKARTQELVEQYEPNH